MIDLDWFNDKTVAVVGNAQSQLEKNQGLEIDSHDLVIRMNRAAGLTDGMDVSRSHGVRTDVWSLWTTEIREQTDRIRNFPGKIIHLSKESRDTSLAHWLLPTDYYDQVRDKIKVFCPSSGFLLLNLLADLSPRQANVYGFDFKRTASHGYKEILTYPHFFDKEEDYCRREIFTLPNFNLK